MYNYDITTYHFGCDKNGDSITTNTTLQPWDSGTPSFIDQPKWLPTNIACPKCGEMMLKENGVVYTSNPPQYGYKCCSCGYFGYRFN